MLFAVATLLSSCGDNTKQVQQPVKGPAATGSGTNVVTKVTVAPAPPPPVTSSKPAPSLFAASGNTNAVPAKASDVAVADKTPVPAPQPVSANKPGSEAKPAAEARSKSTLPTAKVVMVNTEMKFVVLEFSTSEIPTAGSQITLYRDKARVATVKATDPMKPPLVTADIVDGEPRKGDEVR